MISIAIRSWTVSTNGTTGLRGIGGRFEVLDHRRVDRCRNVVAKRPRGPGVPVDGRRFIEAGDVDAVGLRCDCGQCFLARVGVRFCVEPPVANRRKNLFAVAGEEDIDESGPRLRIHRARSAGDYQRIREGPLRRLQRYPSQVQDRHQVRRAQFVLQREAENVEFAQRAVTLQAEEGIGVLAEHRLQIQPPAQKPAHRPSPPANS